MMLLLTVRAEIRKCSVYVYCRFKSLADKISQPRSGRELRRSYRLGRTVNEKRKLE